MVLKGILSLEGIQLVQDIDKFLSLSIL